MTAQFKLNKFLGRKPSIEDRITELEDEILSYADSNHRLATAQPSLSPEDFARSQRSIANNIACIKNLKRDLALEKRRLWREKTKV